MTEEEEDNFYQWERCGHNSSSPGKGLPERIQYKGYWIGSAPNDFELVWYTREDVNRHDQNLIIQMLAVILHDNGYRVGWQKDLYDSDAIALVIELPQGRIDYSIPISEKIVELPEYEGEWLKQTGGATISQKHERIIEFIRNFQSSSTIEPFEA